ncbi:polysaccharide deacetylase family protein [bacterium]|nr:polysaccharide deacetylase family protein [bacterium]
MNSLVLNLKRIKTRSAGSLIKRIYSIERRYGFNKKRFKSYLVNFIKMTSSMDITPCFPVPGAVISRNMDFFREMNNLGADFAAHGFVHIDYSLVTDEEFKRHLTEIKEVFGRAGIECRGFRFPFFRKKKGYKTALMNAGFDWDSSEVVSFPINDGFSKKSKMKNYYKIRETYEPFEYGKIRQTPDFDGTLVEIPASIPDDDILVERFGMKSEDPRWSIWPEMLNKTKNDGGLLVVQAHPERYNEFSIPLKNLIEEAKSCNDIWITSMNNLSDWWTERSGFKVSVKKEGELKYRVNVKGSQKLTVLVKNVIKKKEDDLQYSEYSKIKERSFVIDCIKKPVIGISRSAGKEIKRFLTNEGFVWEEAEEGSNFSLFIKGDRELGERLKLKVLNDIEKCPYQLIRIWRWPGNKKSAFILTGDIDGVTQWDIWMRNYGK